MYNAAEEWRRHAKVRLFGQGRSSAPYTVENLLREEVYLTPFLVSVTAQLRNDLFKNIL